MWIDIHTHITYQDYPEFRRILKREPFTAEILIRKMDIDGIDKSVVLPLNNPECMDYYGVAGNQEVISQCRRFPDRLIPFCNVDPRIMMNQNADSTIIELLKIYKELGCLGIGEMCASLPVDDARYQRLYAAAGQLSMPIIFHFKDKDRVGYGAIDELGLPRLEKMLKMFPDTVFLGHSQCFWNELDADIDNISRQEYVRGEIKNRGRLWKLFAKYPNLYGDCSSGSGYIALSRDPKGYEFIEKFKDQICFGTDRFSSLNEPVPEIISYLKEAVAEAKISGEAFEKITHLNFEKLAGCRF
ncbi:amidohydrolase family protein [Lentisphaerota bacterium ZTH]|nr:amidohydrolase family protein [Lentisphaerota bacterium]WET05551.1 amidohydrolase family protein [Lentisphaerota bacterium ZTH]